MLRIERAKRLDAFAAPVQQRVGALLDRAPSLADALHGRFLHHPAHPAIVALPLGAFGVSSVADALSVIGLAGDRMRRGADLACGVGVATSGVAAVTGLADWASSGGGEARRVGLAHAALNLLVSTMMARSLLLGGSLRHPHRVPLMRLTAFSASLLAGWLGGELVYRYRLGVDHADRAGPTAWRDVDLPAPPGPNDVAQVDLDGVPVLVWRDPLGVLHGIGARCGHLGGPLGEGCIRDGVVTCPWHGSEFALADGGLLRGPATRDQPAYEAREAGGGHLQLRAQD